ncbi:MAG: hypothetical protein V8Q79_01415 [Christensenellales bacterium]
MKGIAVRFMGDTLRITAGSAEENAQLLKNFESLVHPPQIHKNGVK